MVPVNSYSDAAKAQDAAHDQAYRKIQRILTDKASEVHQVEALLDDAILTDNDIRKLFGGIRENVLLVLWQHREGEIWMKRAEAFGAEYAMSVSLEGSVASLPDRLAFYREMDEQLEMGGIGREHFKHGIMAHVNVYRDTRESLDSLRAAKAKKSQEAALGPRVLRL